MFCLASLSVQRMNSFKTLTALQVRCANASKSLLTQLFPHKVPGAPVRIFPLDASLLSLLLPFLWIVLREKGKGGDAEQGVPPGTLVFPQAPKPSSMEGWGELCGGVRGTRASSTESICTRKDSVILHWDKEWAQRGYKAQLLCRRKICNCPYKGTCQI